eukprot:7554495-Pyramimonas_sp.AAC.1
MEAPWDLARASAQHARATTHLADGRAHLYFLLRASKKTLAGAKYGATQRVKGVPTSERDACARNHWGLRSHSLWGHGPFEGCAEMGAGRR